MTCNANNCNNIIGVKELYVRCWICENEYHAKCAVVSKFIDNALRDSSKGLRWACEKCNSVNTDFYKLFKQCRSAFLEMSKDMASVQSKLAKYENIFKEFTILTNVENSPPLRELYVVDLVKNKTF